MTLENVDSSRSFFFLALVSRTTGRATETYLHSPLR